jgi:hypothetical protein
MAKKPATLDDLAYLLQHLIAIELWRSGLSQTEIRARLGIDSNTISTMLKGLPRHLETHAKKAE